MATWNSRGLRGSTLEEFINRTNETYLTNGLALIQKVPTPITPINRQQGILRWHILNRKVPSTILAPSRESRCVLTQRNVRQTPFRFRISMNIR